MGNKNGVYIRKPKPGNKHPKHSGRNSGNNIKSNIGPDNRCEIPLPIPKEKKILLRALYPYEASDNTDLSFIINDLLIALEDFSNKNWFLAQNTRTNNKGLIPLNYVRIEDGSPSSYEFYYEVNRVGAERLLQLMSNPPGTFLIRPSTNKPHLALSVRITDSNDVWTVKHFVLHYLRDKWFLSDNQKFDTVADLINHYKTEELQSNTKLISPLPRNQKPPMHFQQMEVSRSNFLKIDVVGSGNYGEVWKARWGQNSNNFVAIKCIQCNKMSNEDFLAEARIIHNLRHPRIVELLGVCTLPVTEPIFIITEYMSEGSLLNFIRSTIGKSLNFKSLIDIITQISEGMEYLEQNNYVHRDLRAANILVDSNYFVKVADFGLSHVMQQDEDAHNAKGSPFPVRWTAPEAATKGLFSIKSDVWSFGVLVFEIITYGGVPYASLPTKDVIPQITYHKYRLECPNGLHLAGTTISCPKYLYNVMLQCWHEDPESRPTFSSLAFTFGDWNVSAEDHYEDN